MVRAAIVALCLIAPANAAIAQSADWRKAGGDLFVGVDSVEDASPAVTRTGVDLPRLAPLTQPFMKAIEQAAERHGLDPKLLHALVVVESAYQPNAVSSVGASGLTQLMPGTATELGVANRFDPVQNLFGGADYLARQVVRFGDLRLALAAYNAGPGRVAKLGRVPDIRETQAYVTSVVDCYLALSAGRGVRNAKQCRLAEPIP
jgi:soluble lytic murein transglycosylase-like protein